MYAPSPYELGSSTSHLDLATFTTSLMSPQYSDVIRQPDLVSAGILNDIGWSIAVPEPGIVFTLLGGPRLRLRPGRAWQPFAQASAGIINVRYSDDLTFVASPTGLGVENSKGVSHTGLAVAAGGGLDWFKGRAIIRLAQFDLLHYDAGGRSGNTVRFSAGVRLQLAMPK
jgi:hypothetical protein